MDTTFPSLTGSSSPSVSKANLWKYGVIVILVFLASCALMRFLLHRRTRRSRQLPTPPSPSACPAYSPTPTPPPPLSRLSVFRIIFGCMPSAESCRRDEEAFANLSREEQARHRRQNADVRRALQEAGLLLAPPPLTRREEQEREERRARQARRREARREEEAGVGLPAYTTEKGSGEKVLLNGRGSRSSGDGESGEESGRDDDADDEDRIARVPRAELPMLEYHGITEPRVVLPTSPPPAFLPR